MLKQFCQRVLSVDRAVKDFTVESVSITENTHVILTQGISSPFLEERKQFSELDKSEVPKQMNFLMTKSNQFSFIISFSEGNGAEDNQVVVDIEIWRGLVFEQSLVVTPNVKEFAADFNFSAGNQFTVKNLLQVLENAIRRDIPDVGRNGIGCGVVFERENSKRRTGIHHSFPPS